MKEATRLGAKLQLDAQVEKVSASGNELTMVDGSTVQADVIIGADGTFASYIRDKVIESNCFTGLWSSLRESILNKPSPPTDYGDLAYRATFNRSQLEALNDPSIEDMCAKKCATLWLGPDKHCIFYPIRAGSAFNLVLLRPDNLPTGTRTAEGDISEMRATFDDWDPT